ncbi:MAG TPA: nucleotide sugar dehydrogenase [candidate division Zixibacteria bacterium]|nr:nucleotide sugar dehydrogenase [candidate division Zixibacteria bacterium]
MGLGYVGLPLAVEMAKCGFDAVGIDIDGVKVESVNAGISYVPDVPSEELLPLAAGGRIRATQSLAVVERLDALSICVPTPLRKSKEPDLSFVTAAAEAVRNHLKRGQLIILESTTYPGTTRDLVLPILEKSGLRVGRDFFLAFSPERVDPGNKKFTTRNIPKVVGGVTEACTRLARAYYSQFIETIVPVSSPEVAEMVKLLENTFRSVNIAMANEMAMLCRRLDINVWEVIEAAKTKPFGFMAFYPGPGLGGHCIPVDPYYLTWKSRMNGFEARLIELAGMINSEMPSFVVGRIADALNEQRKSLKGSKILGVGVAYKRDTNDVRESPALDVLEKLRQKGAVIHYSDPYVPSLKFHGETLQSSPIEPEFLRAMDCVVILTDHSCFDYRLLVECSPILVDSRNATKNFSGPNIVPV